MPIINQAELRQRLKECRASLGWSQQDVARYLDIGQATISRLETGEREIPTVFCHSIESFCDKVEAKTIRAEDKPKTKGTDE